MVGVQLVAMLLYAAGGGPLQQNARGAGGGDFEHGLTAWLDSVGAGSCAPVRRTLSSRDGTIPLLRPCVPADALVAALRAELRRTRICHVGLCA